MSEPGASREERDRIVAELKELDRKIYPEDDSQELPERERNLLKDRFDQVLGEYSDRLPRVILSKCPHRAAPLKRAFDPASNNISPGEPSRVERLAVFTDDR
jgi:hypothetical protein